MRWNWWDWGAGLLLVVLALAVGLQLIVVCPGVPRATVENVLGPGEALPRTQYIFICSGTPAVQEQMLENMHTESRRYSHPLGTITIEYRGYRHQSVKNADFVPEWWLIVLLALVVWLVASHVLHRKLPAVPTSSSPA